jgi:MFS family permease
VTRSGMAVLTVIGVICTGCMLALAYVAQMPGWVQIAVLCLLGSSISGWNGVAIAEMARHSPAGSAGRMVGAALVYTFIGVVLGPSVYVLIYEAVGDYGVAFAWVSVATAAGICVALRALAYERRIGFDIIKKFR